MTETTGSRFAEMKALLDAGQKAQAGHILDQLIEDAWQYPEINIQLANFFSQIGQPLKAVHYCEQAVLAEPDNPRFLTRLANALITTAKINDAEQVLLKAQKIDPDFQPLLATLSTLYVTKHRYGEVLALLEPVTQNQEIMDPAIYGNLALAAYKLGSSDKAMTYAEKVVGMCPDDGLAHHTLGLVLMHVGRIKEAITHFEQAVTLTPGYGLAYEQLAKARKFSRADQSLIGRAEEALATGRNIEYAYAMHFALGKMYDDLGEWDKAFGHYRKGNQLVMPKSRPVLPLELLAKEKIFCTRKRLRQAGQYGSNSEVPVFVVGMPRSGTTLIEQIIASHPSAAGAGELGVMNTIAGQLCSAIKPGFFPFGAKHLPTTGQTQEAAALYLEALRSGNENALRVVDKMPGNWAYLGIIALLFPKARIIHAVRHPLDSCLSCYFQLFGELRWSFDLEWIAEHYRLYRQTMAHWKKVLPEGMIQEIHYEQLIDDQEQQSHRLIELCGLPWDPACLAFHTKERGVNTASVWQVRQPIYSTSKQRWIHYVPHISRLAVELGDYLQDDREELARHGIQLP